MKHRTTIFMQEEFCFQNWILIYQNKYHWIQSLKLISLISCWLQQWIQLTTAKSFLMRCQLPLRSRKIEKITEGVWCLNLLTLSSREVPLIFNITFCSLRCHSKWACSFPFKALEVQSAVFWGAIKYSQMYQVIKSE